LGVAQTGTGKTAAFSLPILQLLEKSNLRRDSKMPRALVLTPTRELAVQIFQNIKIYGRYLHQRHAVVYGGVSQWSQVKDLNQGIDILVATPGRLLDLIQQRHLKLDRIEFFVLDEADRMLDMGFMRDIKKILPLLPHQRHSLFFSATMPPEISSLANNILKNPLKVEVTPQATTVNKIKQTVMYVDRSNKINLLLHLLKNKDLNKVLIFVDMKHVANKLAEKLYANGISSAAIHGNKSQNARQKALNDFTKNKVRVLVATDLASRGIDVDGITHVINYELPNQSESYVHRIGRTARAGAEGIAISFSTGEEKSFLVAIEKMIRIDIPVDKDQPYHSDKAEGAQVYRPGKVKNQIESARRGGGRPNNSGGRSNNRGGGYGGGGRSSGGRSGGSSSGRAITR
jgi:ATP-dependent RNA helicase RhlE